LVFVRRIDDVKVSDIGSAAVTGDPLGICQALDFDETDRAFICECREPSAVVSNERRTTNPGTGGSDATGMSPTRVGQTNSWWPV
jgi:hypothetical protein